MAVEVGGSRLAPPASALVSLISSIAGCPVQHAFISAPPATALATSLHDRRQCEPLWTTYATKLNVHGGLPCTTGVDACSSGYCPSHLICKRRRQKSTQATQQASGVYILFACCCQYSLVLSEAVDPYNLDTSSSFSYCPCDLPV